MIFFSLLICTSNISSERKIIITTIIIVIQDPFPTTGLYSRVGRSKGKNTGVGSPYLMGSRVPRCHNTYSLIYVICLMNSNENPYPYFLNLASPSGKPGGSPNTKSIPAYGFVHNIIPTFQISNMNSHLP